MDDRERRDETIRWIRDRGERPDAFMAFMYCGVAG